MTVDDLMPLPGDDERYIAMLREATREHDAQTARIAAFCTSVQDMPGELGELFREIAHTYTEFRAAVVAGATTAGEEMRAYAVVEAAVAAWLWLREGEQS